MYALVQFIVPIIFKFDIDIVNLPVNTQLLLHHGLLIGISVI